MGTPALPVEASEPLRFDLFFLGLLIARGGMIATTQRIEKEVKPESSDSSSRKLTSLLYNNIMSRRRVDQQNGLDASNGQYYISKMRATSH